MKLSVIEDKTGRMIGFAQGDTKEELILSAQELVDEYETKRAKVNDVIDSPEFREEIRKIDLEYDLLEYRRCLERNRPVSKALWKRLKKHRQEGRF